MLSDGEQTAKLLQEAGAYSLKNSPSGIETIKGGSPSRRRQKICVTLRENFEAVL